MVGRQVHDGFISVSQPFRRFHGCFMTVPRFRIISRRIYSNSTTNPYRFQDVISDAFTTVLMWFHNASIVFSRRFRSGFVSIPLRFLRLFRDGFTAPPTSVLKMVSRWIHHGCPYEVEQRVEALPIRLRDSNTATKRLFGCQLMLQRSTVLPPATMLPTFYRNA